jgi:hypothetical protein
MLKAKDALSEVLDGATLESLAESTLRSFESDGLAPEILLRLLPERKKTKGRGSRAEPEYLI